MGIKNLTELGVYEAMSEYAQGSDGSIIKKAPIRAKSNFWHPGKKRKQTRTVGKPRKPKTIKLIVGGKWNYEEYVGNNGQ